MASVVFYDPVNCEDAVIWDDVEADDGEKNGLQLRPADRLKQSRGVAGDPLCSMDPLTQACYGLVNPLSFNQVNSTQRQTVGEFSTDFLHDRQSFTDPPPENIPVFTSQHEQELLTEPYSQYTATRRFVPMRQCSSGQSCIGMRENIPGHEKSGGIILREALTPIEIDVFKRTGDLPAEAKPCILCCRHMMVRCYTYYEQQSVQFPQNDCVTNWYINPRECENGYKSSCMIPMEGSVGWRTMCGSICMVQLHLLKIVRDPVSKVWRVTQDELEWKPVDDLVIADNSSSAVHSKTKAQKSAQPPSRKRQKKQEQVFETAVNQSDTRQLF